MSVVEETRVEQEKLKEYQRTETNVSSSFRKSCFYQIVAAVERKGWGDTIQSLCNGLQKYKEKEGKKEWRKGRKSNQAISII